MTEVLPNTPLKGGRTVVQELWFDELYTAYSMHKRLRVFAEKGTKCVACGAEGKHLIESADKKSGALHVDLYTADLELMTVDHIIPKSKGGKNHITNYQPMCFTCNAAKGNKH